MEVDIKVMGDIELSRKIQALVDVAESKHIRQALREGSKPIVQEARARAPSKTIKRGIRFLRVVRRYGNALVAEVGLPGGRKPWFHGLFIERGTGPRVQKKGRSTGSMPAQPFLRPAAAAKAREASEKFYESLRRRIEAVARG